MKGFLSAKCRDTKPSLMMKMAAMAEKMPDSIDLTLGEPDIPTPEIICSALYDAAKRGENTLCTRNGAPGTPRCHIELLEKEIRS